MNEPSHRDDSLLDQLATTLAVGGRLQGSPHHVEAYPDRRQEIGSHLESVRSRIDEAIQSCSRRETLDDLIEPEDGWEFVPHHMTEIDSLKRLRQHLDRLQDRLQHLARPRDFLGEADPIYQLDMSLTRCSARMVKRFELPGTRHDLQADVESDLCDFETLLNERLRLYPVAAGLQSAQSVDTTKIAPDPGSPPRNPTERVEEKSSEDFTGHLHQYRDVLRRVDGKIAAAEGDLPLQLFWRGVKHKYREEAARLGASMDRERILLSISDV